MGPKLFNDIVTELSFVERRAAAEGIVLSLLAGQNVLLLGPPGTAKSLVAQELCNRLDGGKYFQRLMTKFTAPEELFGPLRISKLKEDKFERATDGYLPVAHVAFLDEVFKGSSAVLNTLLTLINERVFYNGAQPQTCPLIMLVGASNEFGEDDVEALYDRFLLRIQVEYVRHENVIELLKFAKPKNTPTKFTLKELDDARAAVQSVKISDTILKHVATIRQYLNANKVFPSDRRLKQCLDLLRAKAWLAGTDVEEKHLMVIENALWLKLSDRGKVEQAVIRAISQELFDARHLVAQTRKLYTEFLGHLKDYPDEEKIRVFRKEFIEATVPLEKKLEDLLAQTPKDFMTEVQSEKDKLRDIRRSVVDADR